MKKRFIKQFLLAAVIITGFASCKKILDVKPEDELDVSQMYRNVYDADAAVVGVYGKFMGLADRYILLNELRADMLDFTSNADQYVRQLSTHTVTPDNPYANPRPFYELIINCNDVLKHFKMMREENKLKQSEFDQRYSDIAALRSFLYLQLGIHYGDQVRYVTEPLENINDVMDESKFPPLTFNVLLDSLVNLTEALPYKLEYPSGTTLNITVDGYKTDKFYINKRVLLGDLNLWKGNYERAAYWYRQVMETATSGTAGETYYSKYKLGWAGGHNHYVSYSRAGDATSLVWNDGWRYMFERPQDDGFDREWIWALPFDSKFKPDNPLIKLFSPVGGDYLVKPSQSAIDNWNSQEQRPAQGVGLPYDARGLFTWTNIGGQPVVMKYLYNYLNYSSNLPLNFLQKNGKWFLFRQTQLHLRFSEAANRMGRHLLAWGLLNNGIAGAYPAPTSNVTDYHNTLSDPDPVFQFDARNSGSSGVPYYRADWYRNIGIRARANLVNLDVSPSDSLMQIEDDLINETALENGYEGTRWPDLLRIALRRNDFSFIANKVGDKLRKDGMPGEAAKAQAKLSTKEGLYLPFVWK
jgi:starch-binding outer membrane protein, SusD/RagB family